MTPRQVNRRAKELGAIHAGKRTLGLDDDDYRGLLEEITGKRSAGDLTTAERGLVLDAMRELGFGRSNPWSGRSSAKPIDQTEKVRKLWKQLASAGALRDDSERALQKFAERQTGKSRLEWCTPEELNKVIEGLKAWLSRHKAKEAADG